MKCKNCKSELRSNSEFCDHCGGKVVRNRLTFKNLAQHFSETFLNYDNKILQTFIDLFKKPEEVIVTYIKGVRKRYTDVLSYFAVALTFSGFQIFVLEKFFPDLFDMKNFVPAEQVEFQQNFMDILMEYQAIFMMLYAPLYALIAKLVFFNHRKFNYTELLVVFLYVLSQISIVSVIFTIIAGILNFRLDIFSVYLVMPFQIFYSAYVLKRIYEISIGQIFIRTILFGAVVGVLFVIGVLAVIGIMFVTGDMQELIEAQKSAKEVGML